MDPGLRKLTILVAIAAVIVAAFAATQTVSADDPNIDPTACGGTPAPNLYCDYENNGEDVVIGPGSCNVIDACLNLGDGVVIGSNACTHTSTANVCTASGTAGGSLTVGDNACTGSSACKAVAAGNGVATIAAGACQGTNACEGAGSDNGSVNIGPGSCIGPGACGMAGSSNGSFTVGTQSCQGEYACSDSGSGEAGSGSATIGDFSCLGDQVCEDSGVDGVSTIGSYSCSDPTATECGEVNATIGNCEFNSEPEPAQCVETITVRKLVFPFWDSGRFNLLIGGSLEAENVGFFGSTSAIEVSPGTSTTISEEAYGNSSLDDYRTTVVCFEESGGFVAYGFSTTLDVPVDLTEQVICTFINQRIFDWFWWLP